MIKFGNWQGFLDEILHLDSFGSLQSQIKESVSDEERIQKIWESDILLSQKWISKYFEQCKSTNVLKDAEKAAQYRKHGNEHFIKKRNIDALTLYNKCIAHAPCCPDDCTELAMGLANRSAVLFHMGQYELCIKDIDKAILNKYPENMLFKLVSRKTHALCLMGKKDQAIEELKALTSDELWRHENDCKKKDKTVQDAKVLIDKCKESSRPNASSSETCAAPSVVYGKNQVVIQATEAVSLKCSEVKGRHLVANRPLKRGDVLIVERPYAAVLLPPHYQTHCHHCTAQIVAAVHCNQCCDVQFCSDECFAEAWKTYHCIECTYMDLLHSIGIAHLSLRVILTAGLDLLINFKRHLAKLTEIADRISGLNMFGLYDRSYISVYDLMPHTENLLAEDLCQYTVTAGLLLTLLKNTQFFPDTVASSNGGPLSEMEVYVGSLLLRHVCQLVCNAHAITDLQVFSSDASNLVETSSQERIATAIYPTASLMNHSCDPTIISSFDKNTLVVRAVKDVATGEEIFNCYGPHCKRMSFPERQRHLQEQYFFHCQCAPCQSAGQEEHRWTALKCPHCEGAVTQKTTTTAGEPWRCLDCGQQLQQELGKKRQQQAEAAAQLFQKALHLLEADDLKGGLKCLQSSLETRRQLLFKYNKDLAENYDAVARYLSVLGQYSAAADQLGHSVATTEAIYGADSIELAHELHKYSEVLFHARRWKELKDVVSRAKDIFIMNYGENHAAVGTLAELEDVMKGMTL